MFGSYHWFYLRDWYPIPGLRQEIRVRMIILAYFHADVWVMGARRIDTNGIHTMVELMDHPSLV